MASSNSNQQIDDLSLNKKHILSHYDPAVLEVLNALKLAETSGASAEVVDSLKKALELVDLRFVIRMSMVVVLLRLAPCEVTFLGLARVISSLGMNEQKHF